MVIARGVGFNAVQGADRNARDTAHRLERPVFALPQVQELFAKIFLHEV